MFNISFGEIVVVAVVGLIIIGPRRLPETARFVGHLVSRVQRQAAEVKADIRREMDLEDLKSIHREYENAARGIGDDFKKHERDLRKTVDDAAAVSPADFSSAADSSSAAAVKESDNEKQISHSPAPWPQTESGKSESEKKNSIASSDGDAKPVQVASRNSESAAATANGDDASAASGARSDSASAER